MSVNGKVLANTALHDGYLVIDADPKAGDVIRLELPMEFRVLDNKSDAAFVNLAYGAIYSCGTFRGKKNSLQHRQ